MDRTLIDQFAAQADVPARAIQGLDAADLLAYPIPGTWSIQQIVVHLLESDLAATHRMRRIAGEDLPLIIAYDETALAKNLQYDRTDLALTTDLFAANRRFVSHWLRLLPDETFTRRGVHNQNGFMTLRGLVETYIRHVNGHMEHLRKKRALLGKPLGW